MKTVSNVYLFGFLVILSIILIDSTAHSTFRTRARATRGFKNAALSTARGFGKRDGLIIQNPDDDDAAAAVDLSFNTKKDSNGDIIKELPASEKFPVDWFVEELTKNPRLARIILKKFVDKNQDDMLSSEELLQNVEY